MGVYSKAILSIDERLRRARNQERGTRATMLYGLMKWKA
jgi:hypothetical protein